jgi:formylglycine-generating enzyme required for sulfatase activity
MPRLCSSLLLLLIASSASALSIDWAPVGNPGNACDPRYPGGSECYGAVPYEYHIAKYEVTNSQYAEFLNAVASAADPNQLYNSNMEYPGFYGGIRRTGAAGAYHYEAMAGREQMPAVFVSFWNALRFANWVSNGQPIGTQNSTTTENGSYTLTSQGMQNNTIVRNPNATIVLASEDEWYKSAYYDPSSATYHRFAFADGFDGVSCVSPGAATTSHSANCNYAVQDLTPVGSYPGSPSSYGTFDQTGNVFEWTETIAGTSGYYTTVRVERGGGFSSDTSNDYLYLSSTFRPDDYPANANSIVTFRLVLIPEPGTGVLVAAGLLGLAGRRGIGRPV